MGLRRSLIAVVAAAVIGFTGCGPTLHVERVIDGDTFELSDGSTVRLVGIDAPETVMSDKLRTDARRYRRPMEEIRALGRKACRHARQLAAGRRVRLELDPADAVRQYRDAYGRTLAYIWVLDNDGQAVYRLNDRLIRDGYVYVYTEYPFEYREAYLRLQEEARAQGRGLWNDGFPLRAEPYEPSM